jgi:hypothetical protein
MALTLQAAAGFSPISRKAACKFLFDGHLRLQNAALAFVLRKERHGHGQKSQATANNESQLRYAIILAGCSKNG